MDPVTAAHAADILARAGTPLSLATLHARLSRRAPGIRGGPSALRAALERRPGRFLVFDPPRPAWLEASLTEPGSPYRNALATAALAPEPHVLLRPDSLTDASMVPSRDEDTLAPVWVTLTRLWEAADDDRELRDAVAAALLAAGHARTALARTA